METAGQPVDLDTAKRHYTVARARAMSAGVHYYTIDQLADQRDLRSLVRRALAIEDRATSDGRLNPDDIDAMSGETVIRILTNSTAAPVCARPA